MSRVVLFRFRPAIAYVASLVPLLACSDRQPTDVPDAISLMKGGQTISTTADLTMSGGMTASGQVVSVSVGEKTVGISRHQVPGEGRQPVSLAMALSATHSAGFMGGVCDLSQQKRANPDFQTLFDKLIDGQPSGLFHVSVDKTTLGSPSPEAEISLQWEDEDGEFSASVGRLSPTEPGSSTVTMTGDLTTGLTITFTGGRIRLRDWTGPTPTRYNVTCPVHEDDAITLVLTQAPS